MWRVSPAPIGCRWTVRQRLATLNGMTFSERLFGGGFPVALEITPPQRPRPGVLLRRARLIDGLACAINVIQRPDRQPSLDASIALSVEGLEAVWHLVARGLAAEELDAQLTIARAGGIRNVLCIRGDHGGPEAADALTVKRVVERTVAALPDACVGATANQYQPDRAAVLRNLLPKLKAGARYVQTQPVFDAGQLAPLVAAIREAAPGTKVVAMAMPLLSLEAAAKIEARLGIALPAETRARIGEGAEGGWAAFEATLAGLVACGDVDGVAIMTFEMDAPDGMGERIRAALERVGLGARP